METRERRIVSTISDYFKANEIVIETVAARAHSLPAMLRRHGPARALLFLASKAKEESSGQNGDKQLAECLIQGIEAATGAPASGHSAQEFGERLATSTELPRYLLEWEAAIESSGWIKLLVDAKKKDPANSHETPTETAPNPQRETEAAEDSP